MIINGDSLSVLKTLDEKSVQCCVTSPPYWGLRDYGVDPLIWDEVDGCRHEFAEKTKVHEVRTGLGLAEFSKAYRGGGKKQGEIKKTTVTEGYCIHCGAWIGCLGLEPTVDLFVKHLTDIFREVRRVLRDDGTLWLNLGDSYVGGKGQSGSSVADVQEDRYLNGESFNRGHQPIGGKEEKRVTDDRTMMAMPGLKPKDLVGIPWRVALALQVDGWYLRSDIIWHKPNPMPESVTDRPTKSHEYIFLLSKSPKYFYDYEAIKEKAITLEYDPRPNGVERNRVYGYDSKENEMRGRPSKKQGEFNGKTGDATFRAVTDTRNKRSVWTVATKPYSGAHFAVFPEELITPCILAGSRVGDTVLDPFFGSGTTGAVAKQNGRDFIGIELNPKYIPLAEKRLAGESEYLFGNPPAPAEV